MRGLVKISVITVCYNSADVLDITLRSAYSQGYSNVEHIVIDGASTDGTPALLDTHREWISKMVSEPDYGIYDAMNKGLRIATGDVVGFLNAGDRYAHPDVLQQVANQFDANDADAVFGDVTFFRPSRPDRVVRRYHSGRFTPARMAWGWMPAHQAFYARRRAYERVGEFRTDMRIAGDFDWMVRAFLVHRITYSYLPWVMVNMALGGASTGGLRATIRLNQEVLRACRDHGLTSNWFKLCSKYPYKLFEFVAPRMPRRTLK
jgi:glycosyltransferase involved in cell wall biosynthesis